MEFETLKKDNRKKYIIGVIVILAITSVVFFVSTRANYKDEQRLNLINTTVNYSTSDLNVMAIKVQNSSGGYEQANTVPTSGYTLSDKSYCEVNGSKDTSIPIEYINGKVTIGISSKGTKCYLYFDTKKTASEYLIAKNEMVYEAGYRYEGVNPNNYVTFNNELWRIIGVFDTEMSTGSTEQLVKLIRNEGIGGIAWDTLGSAGSNDWTQSDIKTILNGQYYNGEDINYTYRNPNSNYIKSNPTLSISGVSINDTARELIESVKWNLGGATSQDFTPYQFYEKERGSEVYGSNPIIWNGYIGLMYPSDYGFAADASICDRTTQLRSYNNDICGTNSNWLYFSGKQWTISCASDYDAGVFPVVYYTYDPAYYSYSYYITRPSLYLKSKVSIVDNGKDGSESKPYDLVLN